MRNIDPRFVRLLGALRRLYREEGRVEPEGFVGSKDFWSAFDQLRSEAPSLDWGAGGTRLLAAPSEMFVEHATPPPDLAQGVGDLWSKCLEVPVINFYREDVIVENLAYRFPEVGARRVLGYPAGGTSHEWIFFDTPEQGELIAAARAQISGRKVEYFDSGSCVWSSSTHPWGDTVCGRHTLRDPAGRPWVVEDFKLLGWILNNPDLIEKTPRDVRTRAEIRQRNKSKPDRPSLVTIVDLRAAHKKAAADVERAERTYAHRWIVRGHWHHFWTGPRNGERKLEARYVMPYVKGPDGAPLNVTEKVSVW